MSKKLSIQVKAAILLIVFSLNTVVGFACGVGIDMGFNSTHHHDEEATETSVHIHADGIRHVHHDEVIKHHDEAANNHHESKNGKDNCCNDMVKEFNQFDKSLPHSVSFINPVFFVTFVSAFYNIDVLFHSQITPNTKYFVRSYHPPIPDVRIAIQSFQI